MTRPLSPAAQAVLTELTQREYGLDPAHVPHLTTWLAELAGITARALADQVVPDESDLPPVPPVPPVPPEEAGCLVMSNRQWQRCRTRSKLLAIADELEGQADG